MIAASILSLIFLFHLSVLVSSIIVVCCGLFKKPRIALSLDRRITLAVNLHTQQT